METKKLTAVEWLFAHLLPHLDWSKTEDRIRFRQLEQEALTMEKEKAFEIFEAGQKSMEEGGKGFEQYYNQTYGGNI